ncbi:MAG: sigma 54-interacting transcriptional regulator [Myxococcota bacterium]
MPRLVYTDATGKLYSFPLKKKLSTIGRAPGNDLVLNDPGVAAMHAHILSDATGFSVSAMDPKAVVLVNGRPRKTQTLKPDDQVGIGGMVLTLRMDDPPVVGPRPTRTPRREQSATQLFPQLLKFSEVVSSHGTSEELFRTLLDQVIELTGADKGLLVLVREGSIVVPVARNMERADLSRTSELFSDSILKQVLEGGEGLIVSDAVHDARFAAAQSVVDLKLSSVMCVPLKFRSTLLGALYLGNDKVAGLFTSDDLELFKIYAGQAALILHNAQSLHELMSNNRELKEELKAASFGRIIGQSEPMRRLSRSIEKLANTDISVMIRGETGTGKELLARELHARSSRREKPFISINCGAIPEQLLESELFGHVKGAFTGAVANRVGKFEAADGGTIFLDEIGEMPPALQVKLLRILQERVIDKVGENMPIPVDIRVISATHRNLEQAIKEGSFREDLFYRLNEVELQVPALRERADDVVLLARFLLDKYLERYPNRKLKGFSKEALAALRQYYWPGNVRQLENRLKKAVVMGEGPLIMPEDLELTPTLTPVKVRPLAEAQAEFTLQYIRQVLDQNHGNKSKTARDLDVDPRTIFRYMEKIDGAEDSE